MRTIATTNPAPVRSQRILKAIENARSTNTRRQYTSAWKGWITWCENRGVNPLPANPQDVVEYLSERADTKARSTLVVDRSAIGAAHKDSGYDDPTKDMSSLLKGVKRQAKDGRGQSKPISHENVQAIMESPVSDKDKAIVGLMFYCGLRRSEAAALEWTDLAMDGEHVYAKVRKSKTNQFGEEEDWRGPVKGTAAKCLVSLPKTSIKVLNLTGESVARRFTQAARSIGAKGITGHSGRIGLATTLIERGASTTEVAHAGGWKSERMVIHYSKQINAKQGAVAKYL